MNKYLRSLLLLILFNNVNAQDLSIGYIANDTLPHPMQTLSKPGLYSFAADPSFPNTRIRRITDAGLGNVIAPIYSTIQAWNADESLMLVYTSGTHQLLDGMNYSYIRTLNDIDADDIETLFWHFTDPDILFYLQDGTGNFVEYNVMTQQKDTIVNLATVSNCSGVISVGNDIQMMSWDSDVISFRCGNSAAYYYRISTASLTQFNIANINNTAPMPFPSGHLFYHRTNVYDTSGNFVRSLNISGGGEHSCLGKMSNGDDAYYAVAFAQGPNSGCLGTLVAHNATDGTCFEVTPTSSYGYSQSGTHISALAHKNTLGGWVAVSMMGYDLDGQDLLDQEIFVAQVHPTTADVYRVAHHRSDEDEFNYFGEPHVAISPTGTRLLFGSDWSGMEDGESVDCYVAELNSYALSTHDIEKSRIEIYPNPTQSELKIRGGDAFDQYEIFSYDAKRITGAKLTGNRSIDISTLPKGFYFLKLYNEKESAIMKFLK